MNYLIKSALLLITCLAEIIFSQSIYNQPLYGSMSSNQALRPSEVQQNWINQENINNVETILEETISPDQYIVGPGDQFAINIISSDGVFNYNLQVTPTGDLLLPLIGLINIDQLSLNLAIKKIKMLTNSKYEDAKLEITLTKIRKFKVHVAGSIKKNGFVVISAVDRLSNVIKKSGGFVPLSKEFSVEITHQDGTINNINYLEYLRTGDMSYNPVIINGDRVYIPYGEIKNESIVIRGAIKENGYDIIEPRETLWLFIQRRIIFEENASLDQIYISRGNNDYMEIHPNDFKQFILQPGDQINIQEEGAIIIVGFVKKPGRYKYFIGFSVEDYLGLAGGHLTSGDMSNVHIQHIDKTSAVGIHNQVRRGDIIYVPERNMNKFVGELSILEIISYLTSIVLTYIAATQ